MDKHNRNLEKLRLKGYFADEFIRNYNQIIRDLDKKIRNGEFQKWEVFGELPPFAFASGVNPWCLCQDVPYDKPNPWDFIEIVPVQNTKDLAELKWKWGKPEINEAPGWREFRYKFRVVREQNRWKIAYLEGFDYNAGIQ